MIILNNITTYSFLTILINVGKRIFENIGRLIKKSGDTISRLLPQGLGNLNASKGIAQKIFANKKELVIAIETSIKTGLSQKHERKAIH